LVIGKPARSEKEISTRRRGEAEKGKETGCAQSTRLLKNPKGRIQRGGAEERRKAKRGKKIKSGETAAFATDEQETDG
jgi:hypothetical protein